MNVKRWFPIAGFAFLTSALGCIGLASTASAASLVNSIVIPGESTDLYPLNGGPSNPNLNRLGGFGSDLYYDRTNNVYYGLVDRGPGGGTIGFETRVEKFSLDVNSTTGAISNFKLLETILLKQANGSPFNGFSPNLDPLNGNSANLGRSLDPEGFAIAPNGNYYVSDEYGPAIREFRPDGSLVRTLESPANLLPANSNGTPNFATAPATGRQDNRGFEGVTISPDGTKLFAVLQDPLQNEGSPNGRSSRNVRLVVFDTATGRSTAQYIYQLESLNDLNARVPGSPFGGTAQGRNIGLSAIVALNDREFLVLERDNRGIGVDDPTGAAPISSKRLYKIDLTGATDVSTLSLTGTNALPAGVQPVSKSTAPFLDIASALRAAGQAVPEKFEGVTIGPRLSDGTYAILLATDNDFSVTQNSAGAQLDVCSGGAQVAIGAGCPTGQTLLPSYLYSFKATDTELSGFVPPSSTAAVPEPSSMAGLALVSLGGAWLKRRQQTK